MSVSRRALLQAGAAAGVAGTLGGCTVLASRYAAAPLPAEILPPRLPHAPVHRALNRVAFGPVPGMVEAVESQGLDAWIKEQMAPGTDENPALAIALQGINSLRMDATELRDEPEHDVLRGLQQAALLRAVYSRWQLRERLADFWTNHFNIYGKKGLAAYRKGTDDAMVLRPHLMGRFEDLVAASAQSPAMLAYLDQQLNVDAGPNENYGRELMELHTLGVHGGYTQRDVREVARCFTGWTYENRYLRPKGKFRFDADRHDRGEKTVLGHHFPSGGGMEEGLRVVHILAQHPSTARFVTGKLARYFTGDDAGRPQKAAERAYRESDGDLGHVTAAILASPDLVEGPPIVKRPVDYVVSAIRGLGGTTDGNRPLQGHLEAMGQPLFQWPMPDGYPDAAEAWTGSLLARWNFASALLDGAIAGTSVPVGELEKRSSVAPLTTATGLLLGTARADGFPPIDAANEAFASVLASPAFQWR